MRPLIFAVVSTGAQATQEKYSLDQQLAACREVCRAQGWAVAREISIAGHSRNYDCLDDIMADCPGYAEGALELRTWG